MKRRSGFTLIEILVVFSILAIIFVAASNMFFSILRGTTKTKTMQLVKQNGDYALSLMMRMIRNARNISAYGQTFLTITNPDGGTTVFSCEDLDADGNNEIASKSGSLLPPESLISTDVRVVTTDCYVFTITEGESGIKPDTVAIDFDLSAAVTSDRPEEQAQVKFKTTVSLRNY